MFIDYVGFLLLHACAFLDRQIKARTAGGEGHTGIVYDIDKTLPSLLAARLE